MADRNLEAFNTRLNETLEDSKDIRISSSTIRAVRPRSIQKSIFGEGRVITLKYLNPVEKETLPYFHIFPTIITLSVQPEHITGINLFYLPRRFRKYVVEFYKRRMTNEPEFPRSLMYYDMVKKLRIPRSVLKPAIKKYRFDRAGAVAIEYDSSLWEEIYYGDTADFLERQWRKSSRNTIYRNAIIEIISAFIDIKT
jgi:hypothetical protein|tara:strand:+ start:179 stop:769 length:591 start_codon:yes stop_codon:yes gene_type:complete